MHCKVLLCTRCVLRLGKTKSFLVFRSICTIFAAKSVSIDPDNHHSSINNCRMGYLPDNEEPA